MATLLLALVQIFLVVILADFVAGVVHWFEDAYVREDTPIIGSSIGRANVIHHHLPRYLTRNNWWQSSWDLLVVALLLVVGAWRFHLLTWQVWLFAVISANANEVQKWSHRTRKENGWGIALLQNLRLLQTPQHHAIHHTNPKRVRYCPITNLVNPLLDRIGFWDRVEWLLARGAGLHRRPDTSLPDQGPMPAWLKDLRNPPKASLS